MRLVKSIIKFAAKARIDHPESTENSVILKALRDVILPMLVQSDLELFLALLKDMFPRVELSEISRSVLRKMLEECVVVEGFSLIPSQIDTIIQLDNLLDINSSAILIGSSGSGKTFMIRMLAKAKTKLGMTTDVVVLSPKSCSAVDFFGNFDSEKNTWHDGLFSYIYKHINNIDVANKRTFIVFDGTVDPMWIENINSVLDENRLLTLPNGDKLPLKSHCNILFEVGMVQFFSPALLSRVCSIFVKSNPTMHEYTWKKWLKTHPNISNILDTLYQKFVPVMLQYIESHKMSTILKFSTLNMVTQLCYMFDILTTNSMNGEEYVTCYFIQALYLSLGAMILIQHRDSFDMHVKEVSGCQIIDDTPEKPAEFEQLPSASMYEYFWDADRKMWANWSWNVATYIHEPEKPLSEILVPTSYTTQTLWLLQKVTNYYFHELFFKKVNTFRIRGSAMYFIENFLRHGPFNFDLSYTVNTLPFRMIGKHIFQTVLGPSY
jgi:dynein heavy chain